MTKCTHILVSVCILALSSSAIAHESHGFKHAVGSIGPAISGRYCGDWSQVWEIDKDGDNKVDGCVHIIYAHEKVHIKSLAITNGECLCP